MRSLPCLARAALVAAAAFAATPTLAHADPIELRNVRVHQSMLRTAGQCTYSARLLGAYTRAGARAGDGTVPARDALVNIDTRLECRGAPPAIVRRQLYFAASDEATILARIEAAARAEHAGRGNRVCVFAPVLRTDATGTAVEVSDVAWQCTPSSAPTATTPAPAPARRASAPTRAGHVAHRALATRAR